MAYSDHRLYIYPTVLPLVVTQTGITLENRPMDLKRVVIHKGLTNKLLFSVTNRDRKLADLANTTLQATLINPTHKTRVFTKSMTTDAAGSQVLTIEPGDVAALGAGLYTMFVSQTALDQKEYPVYADVGNNIKFDVQISGDATSSATQPQTSVELQPIPDTPGTFSTQLLNGNLDKNFSNPQHTLAIYAGGFTGTVTIQATCLLNTSSTAPADSTQWFTVEEVLKIAYTGIIHYTFVANVNWIRVLVQADSGSINQVLLRN
jgi:hypothetical protein